MIASASDRWIAIRDAWQNFWYQPDDPIGVSLLRIATGLVLLYTLAIWSLDLSAFFSSQSGWQSAALVEPIQRGQWAFSFWWWIPDAYLGIAHTAAITIVLMFTIGLFTRFTKFAALLVCISYANRVPMVQFGLDQVTAAWMLYLCLGPCGQRLSIDHWWATWLRRRRGITDTPITASPAARLTMRMVQVHLCVIYLWAGIAKLQGASWLSGDAIWWIASNHDHQQVSMVWLAWVPWLYQILTIATWCWEISFSFLVWNPTLRPLILTIGVAMHLGIGLFLGLWPFALIMMFGYFSFVPTSLLLRVQRRLCRSLGLSNEMAAQQLSVSPETPPMKAPMKTPNTLDVALPRPAAALSEPQGDAGSEETQIATNPNSTDPATRKLASLPSTDHDAKKPIKKVKTMLGEADRDNMVLFVERSAKRRCSLIRALEGVGYRCIGLDAWPETIEVYNVLKPRCIMCNGYQMPASELRFWRSQLDERADSIFVVLVEPQQVSQVTSADGRMIGIAIPASFAQIRAVLDNARRPPDDDSPSPPSTPLPESDDDQGDPIFSLSSRTRPR